MSKLCLFVFTALILVASAQDTLYEGQTLADYSPLTSSGIGTKYQVRLESGRLKMTKIICIVCPAMSYSVHEWSAPVVNLGTGPWRMTLQTDGNLVVYDSNNLAIWHTQSQGRGVSPRRLVMQSDGNLVIYDAQGRATWDRKGFVNW